ncbi:putative hydrolase C777.06c isoform X5 [Benincasa hispida]|uniref:putative hydrolase C777.06c isoform X5 n=1 Tax=Benincasa hispida TaxID=102211 RepID=UPI0019002590|nr:putative hydrolase C777.06c isoform X5 [Benincasa hispida]
MPNEDSISFPYGCFIRRVRTIDAVIITHSHADAIGGLDDLRDWTNNVQPSVPIYVAQRDFEVMQKTHYYLVDTSVILPGAAVSELQFNIIPEEPFVVNDLKVTPLPVWHGHGYRSLGFRFGNVCYISDVSEIPEETYPLLKDCEILILDALRPDRSSSTHFGLPRALEEVRKIQPRRTLFIGMMHLMDHEEVNSYLLKLKETEGVDAQLSYDGFRIPVGRPKPLYLELSKSCRILWSLMYEIYTIRLTSYDGISGTMVIRDTHFPHVAWRVYDYTIGCSHPIWTSD